MNTNVNGAAIWNALKDPNTWQALQGVAALTGHTVAVTKIPVYAALFSVLSGLFGDHPDSSNQTQQPAINKTESNAPLQS